MAPPSSSCTTPMKRPAASSAPPPSPKRRKHGTRSRVAVASPLAPPAAAAAAASSSHRDPRLSQLRALLNSGDLLSRQPDQASVTDHDGTVRTVLLVSAESRRRYEAWKRDGSREGALRLTPAAFAVSRRYRCLPEVRGQVQGGIGFILRAQDRADGSMVALKLFHRTSTEHRLMQCYDELRAGILLHAPLHAAAGYGSDVAAAAAAAADEDSEDLCHVLKLRDVVVDWPLLRPDESGVDTGHRACAMVYDWAPGGDMHAYVSTEGSLPPQRAMPLFRQLLLALRALHRRGLAHRDVKPENLVIGGGEEIGYADVKAVSGAVSAGSVPLLRLCDMGFMKLAGCSPADLENDPTTCYQGPERWLGSSQRHAIAARQSWGLSATRRFEDPALLREGDMFGAGVTLLFMLGHDAILKRSQEPLCEGDAAVSAMSLFEEAKRGHGFALLRDGPPGTAQPRLWRYWERYGLFLPQEAQVLLEGLLHPRPEYRWGADAALAFLDAPQNAESLFGRQPPQETEMERKMSFCSDVFLSGIDCLATAAAVAAGEKLRDEEETVATAPSTPVRSTTTSVAGVTVPPSPSQWQGEQELAAASAALQEWAAGLQLQVPLGVAEPQPACGAANASASQQEVEPQQPWKELAAAALVPSLQWAAVATLPAVVTEERPAAAAAARVPEAFALGAQQFVAMPDFFGAGGKYHQEQQRQQQQQL